MKIWTHRYELKAREKKNKSRQGALVKVEWAAGQIGYSDLHPWPEFGEDPLESHLQSLRELSFTPLVENSMEFNYRDREYRLLKRNAFLGLILPRSHKLVFDVEELTHDQLRKWTADGFSHVKIKMGRSLAAETENLINVALSTPMMWRIDFNGRVSEKDFLGWWADLEPSIKTKIDFVEDPTDKGELKIAGPWANDWKTQARAQIRVLKPARESEEDHFKYDRIVFTHSLDHALGQACAAWHAARYYMRHPKKLETCGLASTNFFEPDDFTREWNCEGPRMKPTTGTGFGFDKLLAELKWESLL